jgi:GMP synthase-like glutamine amidotransferase
MHGKVDQIHHDGNGLFAGLPNPFDATRYHSLVIRPGTLPPDYEITAWSELPAGGREIMGVRHRTLPVFGLQFHPESFLSPAGVEILTRFLAVRSVGSDLISLAGAENSHGLQANSTSVPGIRMQSLDPAIEVTED